MKKEKSIVCGCPLCETEIEISPSEIVLCQACRIEFAVCKKCGQMFNKKLKKCPKCGGKK